MHQRMYLCNADGQLAAHLPCSMHNAASFCSRPYREIFFGGCDTICQRASQERDASLHERRVLSQRYGSAMGDRKFCERSLRALPCTGTRTSGARYCFVIAMLVSGLCQPAAHVVRRAHCVFRSQDSARHRLFGETAQSRGYGPAQWSAAWRALASAHVALKLAA